MRIDRVRLSPETRFALTAITLTVVAAALWIAYFLLVPLEWAPPRVG